MFAGLRPRSAQHARQKQPQVRIVRGIGAPGPVHVLLIEKFPGARLRLKWIKLIGKLLRKVQVIDRFALTWRFNLRSGIRVRQNDL